MGLPGNVKNIMFIAAGGCGLVAVFVASTAKEITNAVGDTLMYLLLAALLFTAVGIVAKFVGWQRE
jgi:hypothetical protein